MPRRRRSSTSRSSPTPASSASSDGRAAPEQPGTDEPALTVSLELQGQRLTLLNGGPSLQLTEAFSLAIDGEGQAEVDRYWDALLEGGGHEHACGWLKDRFGLSWQVVPGELLRMMADPDQNKAGAVVDAMMQMVKIDVAALQAAYDSA